MADEPGTAPSRFVFVRLAVRLVAVTAAIVFAGWLFFGYTPPKRQTLPGRQRVIFWHMWTSNWADVVNRIVDRFNRSQDRYEVVPLIVPPTSGSLKTLIASVGGDAPDCMGQWDPVIPAWVERGALTPLEELMTPKEWQDVRYRMYPAVREIGTYKGHFYGLSTGMNIWAIYYRPSHFLEAGLDPNRFPETLEELESLADRLYRYDAAGRLLRIGFLTEWLAQWIAVFGGSLYDPQTNRLTLCHPRNIEALAWLTRHSDRYGFERLLQFRAGLPSTFAADWPFLSGAYSIVVDGQWRVEQLRQYGPEVDYRTVPIPPPRGGQPLACWSNGNFMIIPRTARNKEGAMAFIRFWSGVDDPHRAAEFYTWGGWLPIVPEITEAPAYQDYLRKFPEFRTFVKIMASPNVQVSPPTPVQAYLMNRLSWAEDAARRGVLSPRQALEQVAGDVDRELANFLLSRETDRQNAKTP